MERKFCSFALPDELQGKLEEVCREFGELKSVIVRRALREYLKKFKEERKNS